MPHRSIQTAILTALVAGGLGIESPTRASDLPTPFDRDPSVVAVSCSREDMAWLTPETAFRSEVSDSSAFSPALPLLSIPAVQQHGFGSGQRYVDDEAHRRFGENPGKQALVLAAAEASSRSDDAANPLREPPLVVERARSTDSFAGLQKLGQSSPNVIENLPRLVMMTVFVLVTCLGTLFFGRRWLTRSGLAGESSRQSRLRIVASVSFSHRSQLHVVRYDDREVLVGVDSRGLQQIQIVTASFDDVLRDSQEHGSNRAITEDPLEVRSGAPPRRLFTAA